MSILDHTTRHTHEIILHRLTETRFNVFIGTYHFGYVDEGQRLWMLFNATGVQVRTSDTLSGLLGWLDLVIDAHEGDETARQLCEIAAGGSRSEILWR